MVWQLYHSYIYMYQIDFIWNNVNSNMCVSRYSHLGHFVFLDVRNIAVQCPKHHQMTLGNIYKFSRYRIWKRKYITLGDILRFNLFNEIAILYEQKLQFENAVKEFSICCKRYDQQKCTTCHLINLQSYKFLETHHIFLTNRFKCSFNRPFLSRYIEWHVYTITKPEKLILQC